jgi:hypothetical protein
VLAADGDDQVRRGSLDVKSGAAKLNGFAQNLETRKIYKNSVLKLVEINWKKITLIIKWYYLSLAIISR